MFTAKIAYSYSRVSSLTQRDRGTGIDRQEDEAVLYASKKGFILDAKLRLRDAGKSAHDGTHLKGALGKFVEAVQSGTIPRGTPLLVEAIDRISRDVAGDAATLILDFLRAGIELHTLEDEEIYTFDNINEDGRLSKLATQIEAAHKFSKRLSGRVISGRARGRAAKLEAGAALSSMCPAWLRKVGSSYEVIQDRAETIREIFHLLDEGKGCVAIATHLNVAKRRTFDRKGQGMNITTMRQIAGGWYPSYIDKLRRNIAVMGDYQPIQKRAANKKVVEKVEDPIRGHFPAIIDRDLFMKVSQNKSPPGRRGKTYKNLFTGLLFCAHCGSRMTIEDKGERYPKAKTRRKQERHTVFLQCSSAPRKVNCIQNKLVPYEPIEKHVIGLAKGLYALDTPSQPVISAHDAGLEAAKAERQNITDAIVRLAKFGGDDDAFESLKADKRMIEATILRLEKLKHKMTQAVLPVAWDYLAELYQNANAAIDRKIKTEIRAKIAGFLRKVVDNILIDPATDDAVIWMRGGVIMSQMDKVNGPLTLLINGPECKVLMAVNGEYIVEEMPTPASILAQHLLKASGGQIVPEEYEARA